MTIIGESLNRLARVDPATAGGITDLSRIVGFRNILVHGYTSIDNALVWQLATSKVPPLLSEIADLLSDNEP